MLQLAPLPTKNVQTVDCDHLGQIPIKIVEDCQTREANEDSA